MEIINLFFIIRLGYIQGPAWRSKKFRQNIIRRKIRIN